MLKSILIAGTGSFIGGALRYVLSRFIQMSVISAFPFGTFIVNVAGCLFIGLFYGLVEKGNLMNADWRLFLTVGICGGFTTFSTFTSESLAFLKDNNFYYFFLYATLSLLVCLLATYAGNLLTKIM